MKRSYKYLIIIFVITCLIVTGCSCSKEEKAEANQNVSALKFYAPSDFKSRSDLRGLIYDDNSRKIFAKGDNTDYNTFIYIDVTKQASTVSLEEKINEFNTKNLTEKDVKYIKKDNKSLVVYGREEYESKVGDVDMLNYAYMTEIDKSLYIITISGPNAKKDEVKDLANKVFNSLQK